MGECGTRAGYIRHIQLREPPDDDCKRANAEYQRGRRAGVRLRKPKDPTAPKEPRPKKSNVNIEGHREANYYPDDPAYTISDWARDRGYDATTRTYR